MPYSKDTGSFSLMKRINTRLILNTIRENVSISRTDIAKKTGLTPATVTNISAQLIRDGIVSESYRGASSGGRKPVMLTLSGTNYRIISIVIGANVVRAVLADFHAQIGYNIENVIGSHMTPGEAMDVTAAMCHELAEYADKLGCCVIGVGIGMHGMVDAENGLSVFAPKLGWTNVNIAQELRDRGIRGIICIDNNVKCTALGESWYGAGQQYGTFVCLNIEYGIGGGIVIGNRVFRGKSGGAGEVGHTVIEKDGKPCRCGNRGCLEVYASEDALCARYAYLVSRQGGNAGAVKPADIYAAVRDGDTLALEAVRETARYIGLGVSNIINTFDPEAVIISGSMIHAGPELINEIRNVAGTHAFAHMGQDVGIMYSVLGDDSTLMGGVVMVMEELFKNTDMVVSSAKGEENE